MVTCTPCRIAISPWFLAPRRGRRRRWRARLCSARPSRWRPGSSVLLTAGVVLLVLGGLGGVAVPARVRARATWPTGRATGRCADKGYLTLDIRRYTDVGLSFVLPVVFLLLGGIPLPGGAVWINHGAIRSRGAALAGLAGRPADQPGHRGGRARWPSRLRADAGRAGHRAVSCLALIQVLAFVLNILPVPGLDGFGALEPYLPRPARQLADAGPPVGADRAVPGADRACPGSAQLFFDVGGAMFAAVGGNLAAGRDRLQRAVLLAGLAGLTGARRAAATIAATVSSSAGSASERPPAQVVGLVADPRHRAGRGAHQVAHVQVPGRHAERAGHRVHVEVQRVRVDRAARRCRTPRSPRAARPPAATRRPARSARRAGSSARRAGAG